MLHSLLDYWAALHSEIQDIRTEVMVVLKTVVPRTGDLDIKSNIPSS